MCDFRVDITTNDKTKPCLIPKERLHHHCDDRFFMEITVVVRII